MKGKIKRFKRGNVTTLWLGLLPLFIMMFLFLGNLVMIWLSHSNSQVAGDSGSLAATKRMDHWVKEEMMSPSDVIQPGVLGPEEQKNAFMERVIEKNKEDIADYVRGYVENSGGSPHGKIIFSPEGRIKVQAQTPFESLVFKEHFDRFWVRGSGEGPKRDYLEWLSEPEEIEY